MSMEEYQKKAFDCLKESERKSLFLQLSEGKSSWEAGSILNVSHYKYIEIRERSEKFFRMFSDFFNIHNSIFRPDCPCKDNFKDYIEGLIEKRLTRREAILYAGDSTQQLPKVSLANITKSMRLLKESGDNWDNDTRNLIFEFDRWNNFRILPKILQQPSAFKRRLNKKDKIYIRYLLDRIPDFVLNKVRERFYYKVKPSKLKYYVCLISPKLYKEGYFILPIRPEESIINEMSRLYMYVFSNKEDADSFGFMVSKFADKTSNIILGQKFWPEYRFIVKKAINYNAVNNISFNIKNLDMAYNIHKHTKHHKNSNTKPGFKRASSLDFYKI